VSDKKSKKVKKEYQAGDEILIPAGKRRVVNMKANEANRARIAAIHAGEHAVVVERQLWELLKEVVPVDIDRALTYDHKKKVIVVQGKFPRSLSSLDIQMVGIEGQIKLINEKVDKLILKEGEK
jgi:hypothetical protein